MTRSLALILLGTTLATCSVPGSAAAVDFGSSVLNGIWSDASTWTPAGGPPGASDRALIGSTSPGGALVTSTVDLTGNQAVQSLGLGYSGGGVGTLDLNGFSLTVGNTFEIGTFGATGVLLRTGGGTFSTTNLSVSNGNALSLASGDSVSGLLTVNTGAQLTTASTANLAQAAQVFSAGSQLNLGANLALTGDLDLRGTADSPATVDAGGFDISALNIYLGRFNSSGQITNRGKITASNGLFVDRSNFTFAPGDSATTIGAANGAEVVLDATTVANSVQVTSGGKLTTAATTNVTQSASVFDAGSLLTLGAPLTLAQDLDIRGTGVSPATVDAAGHNITANNIYLGRFNSAGEILNRGTVTATSGPLPSCLPVGPSRREISPPRPSFCSNSEPRP